MLGGHKKDKKKKKSVFGLDFVEIEWDSCNTKAFDIKKVYDIQKDLRK